MNVLRRGRPALPVLMLLSALALPSGAGAHDRIRVGRLAITIGWEREPPVAGVENAVSVQLSTTGGMAVKRVDQPLSVELSFGDERTELPLVPASRIGLFRASVIPTRPGVYAFRVLGRVMGRRIDVGSICSERTFDCVVDVAEEQFPTTDPSAGQLDERVTRLSERTERATDRATRADRLALASGALAILTLLGVGTAVALGRRKSAR